MKVNGNLLFHTLGDGELQNAILERVAGAAGGSSLPPGVAGRICYNTDDALYYYHDGTQWKPFATGGTTGDIQNELDNTQATIGAFVDGNTGGKSGTAPVFTSFTGDQNTITQILQGLDTAINNKDTLAELSDVNDGADWSLTAGQFLRYGANNHWENHTLVTDDLTDTTVSGAELNHVVGVTSGIQTQIDGNDTDIANLQTADDNIQTFIGSAGDSDVDPAYSSTTAITQGDSLTVAIGKLDTAINNALTNIPMGDLLNVVDGNQTGTGSTATTNTTAAVGSQNNTYFFEGNGTDDGYEVSRASLGKLTNVASGVDSATLDDVFAFDGTAWTAITVNTMLDDGLFKDLGDVPDTYVSNALVKINSAGDAVEFVAPGSGSGVQPYDAGLAALASFNTNGILVQTSEDNFAGRTIIVEGPGADANAASRLIIANGDGVANNPTLDLAEIPDAGSGTAMKKILRDSYGRISATEDVVTADITALVDATYVNVGGDTMDGNLTMAADQEIILNTPTGGYQGDNSVVNKKYVDDNLAGLTWKNSVRAGVVGTSGAGNIDLATGGLLTVDGVGPLTAGDRVLVADQTDASENGIYVVAAGAWTRASDMDALTPIDEVNGAAVYVEEGTSHGDAGYTVTSQVSTLGTDDITFTQFNGASAVVAGAGIGKTGNELFVNFGAGILQSPSDEVGVDLASGIAVQLDGVGNLEDQKVTLVLEGSTLTQSASGLKVNAGGITGTEINSSVAGPGLGGGGGSALSVNVDSATIEIATDTLQVVDNGITNAKLANDHLTLATNGTVNATGGAEDIQLGDTFTLNEGEGINITLDADTFTVAAELASTSNPGVASFAAADFNVSGGGEVTINSIGNAQLDNSSFDVSGNQGSGYTVSLGGSHSIVGGGSTFTVETTSNSGSTSIAVTGKASNLSDVTADATAAGQMLVANGSNNYEPKKIQHIHTQAVAAGTGAGVDINHTIGQQYCNVTVVDGNDEVIIPQSITFTDANNLNIKFNTDITFKVVIMGIPGVS